MGKSTKKKNSASQARRRAKRSQNNIVVQNGSAMKDALYGLPLLGKKFEYGHFLYYDYTQVLTGTSGVLNVRYFRANDLYDPDATGTGNQPMGFDQAMTFWEQFAVFGAKCSVTFASSTDVAVRVGIFLSPDTTNPTPQEIMENGLVNSRVIAGQQTGNARSMATLNLNVDNVKYFQLKGKEEYFAADKFFGTAASSPVEMNYFGIFAFGISTATNYTVYFDINLSYHARFQEPRKVAHSLSTLSCPKANPVHGRQVSTSKRVKLTGPLRFRHQGVFSSTFGSDPPFEENDDDEKQQPSQTAGTVPQEGKAVRINPPPIGPKRAKSHAIPAWGRVEDPLAQEFVRLTIPTPPDGASTCSSS